MQEVMVAMNKPLKVLMGTGTLILTLWLCLMGFSTFKMDQKIEPMVTNFDYNLVCIYNHYLISICNLLTV